MRKFGFSWSWKRASGLSAAKGRISRKIGIPLTRSGRERKIGRMMGLAGLGLLGLGSRQATASNEPTDEGGGGGCCGCLVLLIVLAIGLVFVVGLWSPNRKQAKKNSTESTSPPVVAPTTPDHVPTPSPETPTAPVPDPAPTPEPSPVPSPKSPPIRENRTWKDTSGQFSTSARLKSMASGKVHLIKEDGSEITVPMEKLSEDDQKYIKDQMR